MRSEHFFTLARRCRSQAALASNAAVRRELEQMAREYMILAQGAEQHGGLELLPEKRGATPPLQARRMLADREYAQILANLRFEIIFESLHQAGRGSANNDRPGQ